MLSSVFEKNNEQQQQLWEILLEVLTNASTDLEQSMHKLCWYPQGALRLPNPCLM